VIHVEETTALEPIDAVEREPEEVPETETYPSGATRRAGFAGATACSAAAPRPP
jgi:hypothetical protein